jgi:hypothetical protein
MARNGPKRRFPARAVDGMGSEEIEPGEPGLPGLGLGGAASSGARPVMA